MLLGHLPELFEEARCDRLLSHVGAGRFEDYPGHVATGDGLLDLPDVVRFEDDDRVDHSIGHTAGSGPSGHGVVAPPVEVVLEANDLVAARVGSRHPHGHHVGLGAGAIEADFLGAWYELGHEFAPPDLDVGGGAPVGANGHLVLHGLHDGRMVVAENQRAVSGLVVDDLVAVNVVLDRALGVGDVVWEGGQVSRVVGNAVGEQVLGDLVPRQRFRVEVDVLLLDGSDHSVPRS